jgi:hypothetical protein
MGGGTTFAPRCRFRPRSFDAKMRRRSCRGLHLKDKRMSKMIFVNLPVTDLKCSKAFYEAIGAVN